MIKTISLNGLSVIKLSDEPYFYKSDRYAWIKNNSDETLQAGVGENITVIPAGTAARLDIPPDNSITLDGSGSAEIYTSALAVSPFGNISGGGGGSADLGQIDIISNGIYHAEADELDGYDTVNVNVELTDTSGLRPAELGDREITQNGVYHANDDSFDGYHTVTVNVTDTVKFGEKDINANGLYYAEADKVDGYSLVNVNVELSDTSGLRPAELGDKVITKNGTYTAGDDAFDGYNTVSVNVPQSVDAKLGEKTVTANGEYAASDDSLDGFSKITVKTPVKKLGTKTILTNGIFRPSDDFLDGYDYIIVNVPTGTLRGMIVRPYIGTAERIGDD